MTTIEQAYVIGPLVWEQISLSVWRARLVLGCTAYIKRNGGSFLLERPNEAETLELRSLEAAQLAAESWHRERLLPALIPVKLEAK
jgi:hypothetical protein